MYTASLTNEDFGAATNGPPPKDQLLSLIYQNTSDCLFLIRVEPNERYTFVSVNDAFLTVAGFASADVVGRSMEEVVPVANRELTRAKFRQVVESHVPVA